MTAPSSRDKTLFVQKWNEKLWKTQNEINVNVKHFDFTRLEKCLCYFSLNTLNFYSEFLLYGCLSNNVPSSAAFCTEHTIR